MRLRPGLDTEAAGFIALIAACWSQYPGIVFDVDGEMPELRAPEKSRTGIEIKPNVRYPDQTEAAMSVSLELCAPLVARRILPEPRNAG